MVVTPTTLSDVVVIQPKVFADERGFFFEAYNRDALKKHAGIDDVFVQDNHSRSAKGVLRGLHYQVRQPQGKLVRVLQGEIYDVAVDIRRGSPTFGKWVGIHMSAEQKNMIWIPVGFAHGFLVVSDFAEVLYKTTDFYAPEFERSIRWDDATLNIPWPLHGAPSLSQKDHGGVLLHQAEVFA